jgi:hypothetical protein
MSFHFFLGLFSCFDQGFYFLISSVGLSSFDYNNRMLKLAIFLNLIPLLIELVVFTGDESVGEKHFDFELEVLEGFDNERNWGVGSDESLVWFDTQLSDCANFDLDYIKFTLNMILLANWFSRVRLFIV